MVGIPIYNGDKEKHKYKGKYKISASIEYLQDMKIIFIEINIDYADGTQTYGCEAESIEEAYKKQENLICYKETVQDSAI